MFSLREKCLIVPTHRAGDAYRGTRVQGTRPTATSSRGGGVRLGAARESRRGLAGSFSSRFRLVLLFFQELTLDLTQKKNSEQILWLP